MCRSIFIRATTDDGTTPHPEIPESFAFDDLGEEFPICTCYIGGDCAESEALRRLLMEKGLKGFLDKVAWGNIVIEVR